MRIFLITGKAGSGKNEVAKIIQNNLENTVITGLSKYIKLFALELTNWNGSDDNKPRAFLQNMGDTLRDINEDFLTKRMADDFTVYQKSGIQNVIISDVRLIHEIEYFNKLKEYDVITIRVNSINSKRNLNKDEKNHHTETELDNYKTQYLIENKFDNNLEKDVLRILKGLK